MHYADVSFVGSYPTYRACPQDRLPAVALIGRSNVGKSSLVNLLVGRKQLAKTSGRPGKTQLLNHFLVQGKGYLVDLPGYGWARVGKGERRAFHRRITEYLAKAPALVHTLLLLDARHPPQRIDLAFAGWLQEVSLPFSLVFTKGDKPSKRMLVQHQQAFLGAVQEGVTHFTTSALHKQGRQVLWEHLVACWGAGEGA